MKETKRTNKEVGKSCRSQYSHCLTVCPVFPVNLMTVTLDLLISECYCRSAHWSWLSLWVKNQTMEAHLVGIMCCVCVVAWKNSCMVSLLMYVLHPLGYINNTAQCLYLCILLTKAISAMKHHGGQKVCGLKVYLWMHISFTWLLTQIYNRFVVLTKICFHGQSESIKKCLICMSERQQPDWGGKELNTVPVP